LKNSGWKTLCSTRRTILESKNKKVKHDLIKNEVDTARGIGRIVDQNTVEVTDPFNKKTTYSTANILISTGSSPRQPKNFEVDHSSVLDYDSVLKLTHIPRRLVIVGSGIIAFEYATILRLSVPGLPFSAIPTICCRFWIVR
jgi:NAD(P) transhydrogenase